MSKKVIGIIVVAVLLIAVTVAVVAMRLSKVDVSEGKAATEMNLEELNEEIMGMAPFNEMATMDIDESILVDVFQVDDAHVKNHIGKFPMMNVHASMYLIIEVNDGKAEDVKENLEVYAKAYEATWERYLPEQYELVKDRKLGIQGNYVYLIIAESADEIEALLK